MSPLQLLGFLLASWAVIGNDALQTLGPFLQANRGRTPRWLQALALCTVLCGVLLLGWWHHGGDASWGRLGSYPEPSLFGWAELLPPLAVLLLTQAGVPVSTSFLVLTAFTPSNLPMLLQRSLLGYGLALVVGLLLYGAGALLARWWAAWSFAAAPSDGGGRVAASAGIPQHGEPLASPDGAPASAPTVWGGSLQDPAAWAQPSGPSTRDRMIPLPPEPHPPTGMTPSGGTTAVPDSLAVPAAGVALALQWLATAWLWSQWLIQDLANIFIYLPRRPGAGMMFVALAVLCAGVGLLLAENGGAIQAIVRRKSGLRHPWASAGLSLVYGLILALLALWGREPLSTTWVFLGLLAGRELALTLKPPARPLAALSVDLGRDLALAALGLAVSLAVALAVQPLRGLG